MKEQLKYWKKIISKEDCEYYYFYKYFDLIKKYRTFKLKCIRRTVEYSSSMFGRKITVCITMQNIKTRTCFNEFITIKKFVKIYKRKLLLEKIK